MMLKLLTYEMYKEQFIAMTEQYQVSQDGLMASQLTGIDLENNHWMTRLENLNKFVSSYNGLLNRIGSSSSIDTHQFNQVGRLVDMPMVYLVFQATKWLL